MRTITMALLLCAGIVATAQEKATPESGGEAPPAAAPDDGGRVAPEQARLQAQVEKLRKENAALQEEVAALRKELASLRESLAESEARLEKLKAPAGAGAGEVLLAGEVSAYNAEKRMALVTISEGAAPERGVRLSVVRDGVRVGAMRVCLALDEKTLNAELIAGEVRKGDRVLCRSGGLQEETLEAIAELSRRMAGFEKTVEARLAALEELLGRGGATEARKPGGDKNGKDVPPVAQVLKVMPEKETVVLSTGSKDGVKANDVFIVYREGKQIAKVRVLRTIEDMCMALIEEKSDEIHKDDLAVKK